jgi:hypothetical protein
MQFKNETRDWHTQLRPTASEVLNKQPPQRQKKPAAVTAIEQGLFQHCLNM